MPQSRDHRSNILAGLGLIAMAAALVFGIGGFAVVSSMSSGMADTVRGASEVVDDIAVATEAAALSISSVRGIVEDIESTARSGARTLRTVEDLLNEIGEEAAGDVASSLESVVAAMPGIIQTGRVIDRTLSALSLVGVDYDPEVPLDEALQELEESLSPLPGEIRDQVALLEEVTGDLADISQSSSSLAANLLEIRIDLLEAESVIDETVIDVAGVSATFDTLADDFDTYGGWLPWLVVAAAVALGSAGAGMLLIGLDRAWSDSTKTPEQ